jgi:uncharacterized protein (DUF1800 family)
VDGGYTQKDVEEVARCFTGWTTDSGEAAFRYDASIHDPGNKTVLGALIPESGYDEGVAVLKLLAQHPATARFVATKLVRRFVSDHPPAALVERVSGVFAQTGGDIREMCRTILSSDEFFDAGVYRAKMKSPLELVVSSVRAVDATVLQPRNEAMTAFVRVLMAPNDAAMEAAMEESRKAAEAQQRRQALTDGLSRDFHAYMNLVDAMQNMGHLLYQYNEPTGYPDRGDYWMNSVSALHRMSFAASLGEDRVPGIQFGDQERRKLTAAGNTRMSWEVALGLLTGVPGGRIVHTHPAVLPPSASGLSIAAFVGLALGSPDFQHK